MVGKPLEDLRYLAELSRDAGIALVAYLNRITTLPSAYTGALHQILAATTHRKLAILELGSGCGIVGIGLAQMLANCEVLLTDLQEAEEIIARNIGASSPSASSRTNFSVLDWESSLPESIAAKQFDLIMVSDCTYNSDSIPALVRTLSDLVKVSSEAIVVVSMKVRHASEQIFFDLMATGRLKITGHTTVPLPDMQGSSGTETLDVVHIYFFQNGEP